jgi:tRNA dimethylallyltransferase
VINADSAQVYADLRIISARPSEEDELRAPHRLYGYRDAALPCSAADWAADAKRSIAEAQAAGRLPILAGGTGLYIRTLLDGIAPVPEIDPAVREAVRSFTVAHNYSSLELEDPPAAERLRPSDATRVARALEVIRSTGRPLAEWQKEWLHQRCDERFEKMMSDEGIEEVRSLLARRFNPMLPAMRAIGVREIAGFLEGALGREEALAAGRAATRQYAKRQYTWFSRQPPAGWPRFAGPLDCGGMANALAGLDARLSR